MDQLSWHQFYKHSKLDIKHVTNKISAFNRMVYYTNNFFVIVGYGAFNKGYLLVVSKKRISAFALISKNLLSEFKWILNFSKKLLKSIYKDCEVAIFEHGLCACIGGLDRAHLHFMPYSKKNKKNMVKAINQSLKRRRIGIKYVKFDNQKFDHIEDIDTILENFSDHKELSIKGKYLKLNDIKNKKKINDYPLNLTKEAKNNKTYIFFDSSSADSSFITFENINTQLGREIIFNCENNSSKYKKFITKKNNELIWKWQDQMFEKNIIQTIKDISVNKFIKKEQENNQYGLVTF
ncbi:hypothetical protein OAJ74_00300 [Alphaproteobacteria bacterium]|nr:hypothetical protein [Alphaproteobacteria bacterium]